MLCDLAARTLLSPLELPIGVVTSLIGAVAFIINILSRKGEKRTVLEVKSLSVRCGALDIVKGVSFAVNDGEWLTIAGPTGAGKSHHNKRRYRRRCIHGADTFERAGHTQKETR